MFDTNKPTRYGFVDKRGIRTPAERIVMLGCAMIHHSSGFFQMFADKFIGVLKTKGLSLSVHRPSTLNAGIERQGFS